MEEGCAAGFDGDFRAAGGEAGGRGCCEGGGGDGRGDA